MVYDYFDKYTFLCEMYDDHADKIRKLVLNFFPFDNSVQVLNADKGKMLLRRVQLPTLTLPMLQIGNIVNVFSKLLYITDCAALTRKNLFNNVQSHIRGINHLLVLVTHWRISEELMICYSTFALIKPVPPSFHGKIITFIVKQGFRIVRMKNGKISKELAMDLYRSISGNSNMPIIIDYVTSGEVIGLELVAPDAVKKWRACLGATDPKDAADGTLRALYGENILKNVAHGCNTPEEASEMLEAFFGYENGLPKIPFRATYTDCTCCIVKPHVLIDGNVGQILEQISTSDKFYISAMAMFSVKLSDSEEFFQVYKGVLPEFESMCIHLAEGKSIVLEVKCKDPSLNCVTEFRKLCGHRDPDFSRQLYPDSIRALHGKDLVHNAVHCTDLEEDGVLEVEYFFKLMAVE